MDGLTASRRIVPALVIESRKSTQMVAVVPGNRPGLFNTSLTQLGTTFGGQAGIGQSRESQRVDIATGNLLQQDSSMGILAPSWAA